MNEHLDLMDGRYWLRLECRALARALRESGAPRNTAVRDALAFRQARRMRYQGSAEKERALEINEGVASYMGVAAAAESTAGAVTRGIEILTACQGDDSFVRTFNGSLERHSRASPVVLLALIPWLYSATRAESVLYRLPPISVAHARVGKRERRLVPVRGFAKGWRVKFRGIAA